MEVTQPASENSKRDLQLVQKAAAGDQQAYNELMSLYKRRIYSVVLKLINNRDDAEDLTMEVFGKAFLNIASYNPQFAFSTWIGRIATNHTIDHIRKKKLQTTSIDQKVSNDSGDLKVESTVRDNSLIADDSMMKEQRHAALRASIDKLQDNYKTLVKLYYFEEMSYDEIANELDLPLGTVKAQLFRARNSLFEMMKGGVQSGNL